MAKRIVRTVVVIIATLCAFGMSIDATASQNWSAMGGWFVSGCLLFTDLLERLSGPTPDPERGEK